MAERRQLSSVQASLRRFIESSGESRYAISHATGVPESVLSRFMAGSDMRGDNIDAVARHLKLELRAKGAK